MITKDTEKVFFLDAYALIYRAFFALNKNPRMTSKGLNTSAIIGFLNTLYEVIRNEKPSHLGIAFDLGAPTLRTENFCDYKANREEMPPDLRASIPYIIKIIEGFNIPIYAVEGFEADDVIGTLAKKAEKAGFLTYMMTPDKDFGQLVSDNIYIYKPAKFGDPAMVMGPKEVCEKYGINTPEQLTEVCPDAKRLTETSYAFCAKSRALFNLPKSSHRCLYLFTAVLYSWFFNFLDLSKS